MPDTKIAKLPNGWVDLDNPNNYHPVRRLARDARRVFLAQAGKYKPKNQAPKQVTTTVTAIGYQPGPGQQTVAVTLTALQQKLYDRLTTKQGVSTDQAFHMVTSDGYNKAASYGHMRAAGATHHEAEIVVNLNNPIVSLAYGLARAKGLNHTDALHEALQDD